MTKNTLEAAIQNQRWDLAAHALVLSLVETEIKENGAKTRRSPRQSKRS